MNPHGIVEANGYLMPWWYWVELWESGRDPYAMFFNMPANTAPTNSSSQPNNQPPPQPNRGQMPGHAIPQHTMPAAPPPQNHPPYTSPYPPAPFGVHPSSAAHIDQPGGANVFQHPPHTNGAAAMSGSYPRPHPSSYPSGPAMHQAFPPPQPPNAGMMPPPAKPPQPLNGQYGVPFTLAEGSSDPRPPVANTDGPLPRAEPAANGGASPPSSTPGLTRSSTRQASFAKEDNIDPRLREEARSGSVDRQPSKSSPSAEPAVSARPGPLSAEFTDQEIEELLDSVMGAVERGEFGEEESGDEQI